MTAETCPHYLLLSADDVARRGPVLRVNPPIREVGHAEGLWAGLTDGTIDMLATDHAPHTPEEKTGSNIWECWSGFGGLETAAPLMLTEVHRGRITLEQYVEWACRAPARVWGLYPRKGALQVGADADIVILDLDADDIIRGDRRVVMRDGILEGRPGGGRMVT